MPPGDVALGRDGVRFVRDVVFDVFLFATLFFGGMEKSPDV
jgi:hypothetical protein